MNNSLLKTWPSYIPSDPWELDNLLASLIDSGFIERQGNSFPSGAECRSFFSSRNATILLSLAYSMPNALMPLVEITRLPMPPLFEDAPYC